MSIFMFTVVCIHHNERSSQFFAPPVSFVSQLINVLLLVDSLLAERLKCKWGTQCGFFGCLSSSCMMGSSPGSQSSTLCDSLFLWQPQTGKGRKKSKPSYVIYRKWSWRCWRTSSLHPQVFFLFCFFFPPLSFFFTVLTQRWVYTLSVTTTGLFL